MRRGHAGPAEDHVAVGCVTRADADAGGTDVGFQAAAPVDRHGASTREIRDRVGVRGRAHGESRIVDGRGFPDGAASRTGVAGRGHELDPRRADAFDRRLKRGRIGASFSRRAGPRRVDDVGRFKRLGVLVREIRRGDEPLKAFGVRRRRPDALIQVAAADPLRSRRHSDLISASVVADHGPHGVCAVSVVVAGRRGVRPADAAARVDRVVPAVVVVRRGSQPAAVVGLESRMVPFISGVASGDDHALARKS